MIRITRMLVTKQDALRNTFCLIAGFALVSTVAASPIVVGQVTPLSGMQAGDGRGYSAGMQMYFNHINKAGGTNGHTFLLVRKDDNGRPDQTLAATQQLLTQQHPLLLAGYMGSDNLAMLQKSGLLDKEKIALIGYRSGTFQPSSPHFYSVRADLRDEIGKIAQHLATVGVTQLGLLFEEGPDASALLKSAEETISKSGGNLVARGSYEKDTLRMESANRAFQIAKPQAIILVTSGAAASAFIEKYRLEGGNARLFAASDVDLEQIAKRLGEDHLHGISISQVVPNPYRVASKLTKEFREVQAKTSTPDVPISYAMMEGFIVAKVIVEAARRAGSKPTRESMAAALANIDNLDIGGYTIGYRSGQSVGSRYVELSIISAAGRIRQ